MAAGFKCTMDGNGCESISEEEIQPIWDAIKKNEERRKEMMPTQEDALSVMQDAYTRLEELGWRDIIYCPKDGTLFDAIESGSTGVCDCSYRGEWPNGKWYVYAHGDMWPSRPCLFKLKENH